MPLRVNMRPYRLVLVSCSLLFLLALVAAPGILARPTGTVTISGPSEVVLEAGQEKEFQLHVASRLVCARGFDAPRDLIVMPAAVQAGAPAPLWHMTPAEVRVPWKAAAAEPDVYVIDTLVTFRVTSDAADDASSSVQAKMLATEARDPQPRLHCQFDGYELTTEEHDLRVVLVPESVEDAALHAEASPPVRWLPIALAVGILTALAAFAGVRERERRRA